MLWKDKSSGSIAMQALTQLPATDLIGAAEAGTLAGLLAERVRRSPHAIAYREFDAAHATWRDHAWQAIDLRVRLLAAAMRRANLHPGDRVAVALPNGSVWVACDLAAAMCGLVVVPLYVRDSPDSQAFILGHSGARLLIIDGAARWQMLAPYRRRFVDLEHVWIDGSAAPRVDARETPALRTLAQVIPEETGSAASVPVEPGQSATIVYTSGTTGQPKGVILSHRALLLNAEAVSRVIAPNPDDVFLSCLPLAHAFERTVGHYLPMMAGSTVAYARSVDTLAEDFRTIRPTAFLGVPRLYERAYAAIRQRAGRHPLHRSILRLAVAAGWQRFEALQGRRGRPAFWVRLAWPALDRLVGAPARAAFGGRVRCAVSGGAALPADVARLFNALGVPIVEGYGLTEAGPVVAANGLDDNLPGSIGRPLPGIEVRITDRGELVVRTPAVMSGYWRDAERNAQTIDPEGWLHTDDMAEIRDGRLHLKGRFRDVLVLATGEKLAPGPIEDRLAQDALFRQALVVGEQRPFAAAIVVLDREQWRLAAADQGLPPDDPDSDLARAALLDRIAACLGDQPRHAQIRAVHATFDSWTVEGGEMTPTLKIKRDRLTQRYREQIARLYAGHVTADSMH